MLFSTDEECRWVRIDRKAMLRHGREAAQAILVRHPYMPYARMNHHSPGPYGAFQIIVKALRVCGSSHWPHKLRWNIRQKPIARPVKKNYVSLDGNLRRKRVK